MNKRIFFCLFLIIIILFSATSSFSEEMAEHITRPLKSEGPTKVETEIFIIDLDNVDTVNQNFDANVFYRLTWHDPRFAGLDSEKIRIPLNQVWHPHAQLLNQQRVWKTFEDLVDVYPSGKMVYEQRVWGSFSQPLELKEFPFDKQTFNIILVATGYNENEVNFMTDIINEAIAAVSKHYNLN